ncbi:hypothetical protein [uncultured Capnocytophaga sp.]|jgi:hypothetical protein|uniref:hypothetical protein n=1 Tax=Capnocytophaga granulosa TaxID=45242 RepID=UPI002617BCCE|nr:hypothetical protein [uncultured Capnocytophaga sp.]
MSNTADKEAYLKKKQELLDKLKEEKRQILFKEKEYYEGTKILYNSNEDLRNSTIKSYKTSLDIFSKEIEKFKKNEKKAALGIYSYSSLLNELYAYISAEKSLFEYQTRLNYLDEGEKMNLFAVILIGGILLTAGYYALSFTSQSKKTK